MTVLDLGPRERPGVELAPVNAGRISRIDADGTVWTVVPAFDDGYEFGPSPWTFAGTPSVDDDVLVGFDEIGVAWVVAWNGTVASGGGGPVDASTITGVLPVAHGGTGVTTSTGAGSTVLSDGPILTSTPWVRTTDDSVTAVATALILHHRRATLTAAAGMGVGMAYDIDNDTGVAKVAGRTRVLWTSAVTGAESADFVVRTLAGGVEAERLRITSTNVLQIGGTQIAASNLSNGTMGTGAVVLASALPTTLPPTTHASTHQPGGSDAMTVDAAAGTGSLRTLGTGAAQACAGNDARLTNARTPTAHATTHQPGGSDALAVDAAVGTGSLRTIGTGAQQACAGNDSRLSDARTPTAHAVSHAPGGSDALDSLYATLATASVFTARTSVRITDANYTAVVIAGDSTHRGTTPASVAAGFGVRFDLDLDNPAGTITVAGGIQADWITPTAGAEESELVFNHRGRALGGSTYATRSTVSIDGTMDGLLKATSGIATRVKAGTPADADWHVAPPSGTIVVDTTASKIWVRVGTTWKSVAVT